MKIKPPPTVSKSYAKQLIGVSASVLEAYLQCGTVLDEKGRYLPYDELRRRIQKQLDPVLVWSMVKHARLRASTVLRDMGGEYGESTYVQTPAIQRAISRIDREATQAAHTLILNRLGEGKPVEYLLSDLYQEESVSSSQLEGAVTTTAAANEMLSENRSPRTIDEKMIIGNFRLMKLAQRKCNEDLSVELIKEFHAEGVGGIDDQKYCPGEFRSDDTVRVEDYDGNIVHQPPLQFFLDERMQVLVDWANFDHESGSVTNYLPPLIKAITLHFSLAFEHPFRDGNGRVARALFYWYLFKKGYDLFKYISISAILKDSPAQYGKSYIHTEQDGMDLTYFIEHQCDAIVRALDKFTINARSKIKEIQAFESWIYRVNLYGKLSEKQRVVFSVAVSGVKKFTVRNVQENLGCSYNTASAVLNGLVKLGIFRKIKSGKEWFYEMNDREAIMKMFV